MSTTTDRLSLRSPLALLQPSATGFALAGQSGLALLSRLGILVNPEPPSSLLRHSRTNIAPSAPSLPSLVIPVPFFPNSRSSQPDLKTLRIHHPTNRSIAVAASLISLRLSTRSPDQDTPSTPPSPPLHPPTRSCLDAFASRSRHLYGKETSDNLYLKRPRRTNIDADANAAVWRATRPDRASPATASQWHHQGPHQTLGIRLVMGATALRAPTVPIVPIRRR